MKNPTLVFLFLLALSVVNCTSNAASGITVVSAEEMHILLDLEHVQLVDVRTPKEYNVGHLKNAQNIDFNSPTFEEDIAKLDKEKPVVLYCQEGGRSAKCAKKMAEAGFKKIYDLKGGFSEWNHSSLNL